jgi:putative transposase
VKKPTTMGYLKVWIHFVWTTKNRQPMLSLRDVRLKFFEHIRINARSKNIYVDCINGVDDHVHVLVSLNSDQSVAKVMHLLKGESANWINKQNLLPWKFEWQDEYYAGSVSVGHLDRVRKYIHNQEAHHNQQSFHDEFEGLKNEEENKDTAVNPG